MERLRQITFFVQKTPHINSGALSLVSSGKASPLSQNRSAGSEKNNGLNYFYGFLLVKKSCLSKLLDNIYKHDWLSQNSVKFCDVFITLFINDIFKDICKNAFLFFNFIISFKNCNW